LNVTECITAEHLLPHPAHSGLWESIVVDPAIKKRLVNQAALSFVVRAKLAFADTALHGLILLHGPPGTGKTTLAKGLGEQLVPLVVGGRVRFVQVDPHGLMSAEHGQSQQRVMELLSERIPTLADDGMPTLVLIDEVESMTVARSSASLAANPADVHRATDAVLTALDRVAVSHPNVLFVATSNFTDALDTAFTSRADTAILVPLPDADGVHAILHDTLKRFAGAFAGLEAVASSPALKQVAARLEGKDGRQVRKFVTDALAHNRETAVDPGKLTVNGLLAAADGWQGTSKEDGREAA